MSNKVSELSVDHSLAEDDINNDAVVPYDWVTTDLKWGYRRSRKFRWDFECINWLCCRKITNLQISSGD